jgi:carboxymethylenebutenolidase
MNDLRRYLVEEAVEDYQEGRLSRRETLWLLTGLTGAALASQILDAQAQNAPASPAAPAAALGPATIPAEPKSVSSVAPDDPAIVAASIQFPGGDGQLMGYIARPDKAGRFPIVLVCHENRGLTRHFEDVTRRLAKAGYVGLAVDLLSREGGTGKLAYEAIPALLGAPAPARHVQDFQSALMYAKAQPFVRGDRAGMTGFCFGGGVSWRVLAGIPELRAAVVFYGLPVVAADVPKVNAAVLAIYAGRDERINANIPAIEAAMKENAKVFRKIMFPDVDHAFYNDSGERFNAGSALAAWTETLAWFAKYL